MVNKIALHYILFILQIGTQVNMSPVPNHPTLSSTSTKVTTPELRFLNQNSCLALYVFVRSTITWLVFAKLQNCTW